MATASATRPREASSRSGSSRARRSRRSWAERRCERSGCGCGRPARPSGSRRSGSTSAGTTWPGGCPISLTGWTLIACGLVGWARRPESRSGPLLAATGFAWFAANLAGDEALYLHRGPLIQLTLTYPYGRLGSRLDRVAVAVAYGAALIPALWSSDVGTFALCALFVAGRGPWLRAGPSGTSAGRAGPRSAPRRSSARCWWAARPPGSPSRPRS